MIRTIWFWIATQLFLLPVLPQAMASGFPKVEVRQITVRVRNYAQVDPGVLLKAETTANKILQEAGADTLWVLCFDGSTWSRDVACTSLPGLMDLTVNVLSTPASQVAYPKGDGFGYATEEGEQEFGCDAWIFIDRIKGYAANRELNFAQLLGHVFAHELGHMLLGPNSHSGMGLMGAQWTSRELRAADHGGLFFSASESGRIQKAVLARLKAQDRRSFVVPFHSVNGLILLDGQLNGKPAALLLDTGANNSIVDVHAARVDTLKLDALRSTGRAGAEGACIVREVKLSLEHRSWLNRRVCVMDLSDVSRRLGTRIDGFVGQDVLSEFSSVWIDYKAQSITLEE